MGAPVPSSVQQALREVLGEGWINELVPQPTFSVNLASMSSLGPLGPTMVGGGGAPPPGSILRLTVRDRTTAVAVTSASVSVETTRYENWPSFRSIVEKAVRSTGELLRPEGVIRAGLRYIDEVRVEDLAGNAAWADWLSPGALPPAAEAMMRAGHPPVNWTGAAQYEIGHERTLVLRYGPQPAQPGFAVNPDGPLRRIGPRRVGPFFLLDFDSFWQPSDIPRWEADSLLAACDELRRPVRSLFNEIITERLEAEVFNQPEDDR